MSYKSALLSPCVPTGRSVPVSENAYESEGCRFEYYRAHYLFSSICRENPDRPFLFSGVLPAPYHNWYHNEAQEGFENTRPKRPMASRCRWGSGVTYIFLEFTKK